MFVYDIDVIENVRMRRMYEKMLSHLAPRQVSHLAPSIDFKFFESQIFLHYKIKNRYISLSSTICKLVTSSTFLSENMSLLFLN